MSLISKSARVLANHRGSGIRACPYQKLSRPRSERYSMSAALTLRLQAICLLLNQLSFSMVHATAVAEM
jgi:hypothetical protein